MHQIVQQQQQIPHQYGVANQQNQYDKINQKSSKMQLINIILTFMGLIFLEKDQDDQICTSNSFINLSENEYNKSKEMASLVPVTDQDRCRQESEKPTTKSNTTQSKFTSLFSFSNSNETKNNGEAPIEIKKSIWENLFGPPKHASKKLENQIDKSPSLFSKFFSTNLKKEQNKNENEKKQFINEKPQNWPNWTTQPNQQVKPQQKEVIPKPNEVMKDSLIVPRAAAICRSHCLYYEYYHGDDGYTYFYMKNSTEFVGYKQIFEKYEDNSKCYRNMPIIRVNQEQAKRVLDEKKRNGTYQVIRTWGMKSMYPI